MNQKNDGELTPMLKQYYEIKNKYNDCILFFRLGDFYEMFNEDAQLASRLLGLTLTRKPAGKNKFVPLAGIPYHSYENYLNKLVKHGYKVAICEQLEDPSNKANKIVERGVIRIITPGTILSDNLLQGKEFNYLCAIDISSNKKENITGLCFLELSTGRLQLTEFVDTVKHEKLETELIKFRSTEFILPETLLDKFPNLKNVLAQFENVRINYFEDWRFDYGSARQTLINLLNVTTLDGFGVKDKFNCVACAGALLKYIEDTQMVEPKHINNLKFYNVEDYLIIDGDTRRNLELITTMRDNLSDYTLYWAIDNTLLNAGGRLLKDWILNPLIDINEIKKRQNAIKEFFNNQILRAEIRELLKNIYDIERIVSKISCKTVNPRDLISLKISLEKLPSIRKQLENCTSEILKFIYDDFDECSDIFELIDKSINDNPPLVLSEGGIIKKGYNSEIDELRKIKFEGKDFIAALEETERKRTGIQSLKIKYNKVFGYYIEIT
ncbi:MAG TPA: DNA mismatch repair protein MutS, partial [bacterium]|nr:DNA mismatch repair protein MutS [bacterium]